MKNHDLVQKDVTDALAKQKQERLEYCEKLTALADSIIETRLKVNDLMVNRLMEYYALDESLEPWDVFEMAHKVYYEGGASGLYETLVNVSDSLRLECHKSKAYPGYVFM